METPSKVIPGIYQMAIPMPNNPLGYLLSYLIKDENGYIMVDTGWNTKIAWQSLLGQLEKLGVALSDINKILITHLHPDHIGLAGRIKEQTNAVMYLHKEDAKVLRSRYQDVGKLLDEVKAEKDGLAKKLSEAEVEIKKLW